MQERPAPTVTTVAALRGTGAAVVLLAFWCAPVFAAGSDVFCEKAAIASVSLDVQIEDLAIAVVDHGITDAVSAAGLEPAAPSVLMAPRVETILREIFDETVPADHEAADATPISSPHAASLAELTAPVLREQGKKIDDAEIREDKLGVSGVNTRVPGVSEDDLSRYRRQMFRTDI